MKWRCFRSFASLTQIFKRRDQAFSPIPTGTAPAHPTLRSLGRLSNGCTAKTSADARVPDHECNIVLARQVTAARSVVCPPDSMLAVVHSMPLLAPLALVNDDELTG